MVTEKHNVATCTTIESNCSPKMRDKNGSSNCHFYLVSNTCKTFEIIVVRLQRFANVCCLSNIYICNMCFIDSFGGFKCIVVAKSFSHVHKMTVWQLQFIKQLLCTYPCILALLCLLIYSEQNEFGGVLRATHCICVHLCVLCVIVSYCIVVVVL